jgi:endonuclease III
MSAARRRTASADLSAKPADSNARLEQARLYSEELGLDLASGRERDLFLWFIASQLFGQRISEEIAARTFRAFVAHGLTSPQKILDAGWDYLVNPVMREGGYVRYDESKSRKILRACRKLLDQYDGKVSRLHEVAADARDLEARLDEFYGVGPVTIEIFLRELRPFWKKADPETPPALRKLARKFGVDLEAYDRGSLGLARVEAGLIRARHSAPGKN